MGHDSTVDAPKSNRGWLMMLAVLAAIAVLADGVGLIIKAAVLTTRQTSRNLGSITITSLSQITNLSTYDMHDDESETQDYFCAMIVFLLLLSAALMGVLLLFDGSALNTHAAIR
jgi:hypothetical protein